VSEEMLKKIAEIEGIRARLVKGGGDDALAKQKAGGKMTARERIAYLCDGGTFCEYDIFAKHLGRDYGLDRAELPADGVVTGFGKINGRGAFIYSQDFSVNAGTFGEMHGRKIRKTVELARKMGFPLIGINDSGGARVTEEMGALSAYGELFSAQIKASGAVPQIALIMGPVAGGQAYSPSLMDFIFMVEKTSHMFLAGPPLVKALVFQDATVEQLGGPKLHAEVTGVSDFTAKDDADCIERVKELLSYLPPNSGEMPPYAKPKDNPDRADEELLRVIPTNPKKPYDMHEVVRRIVDDGKFLEVKRGWAKNLITAFARMDGHAVGIVASNPAHMAGCLDVRSSEKGSKFVNFCDAFNVPLVTLQDVPGYLVGIRSERDGIIRQGGKMLRAYALSTVPKITVVVRKSYAGGYLGLCSKEVGADFLFELPTAEICLMGAEGAVNVIFRKEISAAANPEEARRKYIKEFSDKYVNPLYSAGLQRVDDIIDPRRMRPVIIKALEIARNKACE